MSDHKFDVSPVQGLLSGIRPITTVSHDDTIMRLTHTLKQSLMCKKEVRYIETPMVTLHAVPLQRGIDVRIVNRNDRETVEEFQAITELLKSPLHVYRLSTMIGHLDTDVEYVILNEVILREREITFKICPYYK